MALNNLRILIKHADDVIDQRLGEAFSVIPWTKGDLVPGSRDTSRPTVDAVGYYQASGARIDDPGGTRRAPMLGRMALIDHTLSVQTDFIGDWRQGDHVVLTERDVPLTFEISYIEPSDSFRATIHLIRIDA